MINTIEDANKLLTRMVETQTNLTFNRDGWAIKYFARKDSVLRTTNEDPTKRVKLTTDMIMKDRDLINEEVREMQRFKSHDVLVKLFN